MKNSNCGEESLDIPASALEPVNKFMRYLGQNERLHLTWCISGIIGCSILYGIIQEHVLSTEYVGKDGVSERFTFIHFIGLFNLWIGCAVSGVLIILSGQPLLPQAPIWNFVAVSGSNLVASTCKYDALKYITFQTLGNCAKMIPVMMWGTLVNQKSYNGRDYFISSMITAGSFLFAITGEVSPKASKIDRNQMLGIFLLLVYLAFDSFSLAWKERMFKGFQMSVHNQMLYLQACSAAATLPIHVASQELFTGAAFLYRHAGCMWYIIILALVASATQLFVLHTIKTFGALLFATFTTLRQFLSVLASCLIFGHLLTSGQSVATVIIFGTVLYQILSSQKKESQPLPTMQEQEEEPLAGVPMYNDEPAREGF